MNKIKTKKEIEVRVRGQWHVIKKIKHLKLMEEIDAVKTMETITLAQLKKYYPEEYEKNKHLYEQD